MTFREWVKAVSLAVMGFMLILLFSIMFVCMAHTCGPWAEPFVPEAVESTQEATSTLPPGDGFMLLTGTVVELDETTAVIEANDGTRYTVLLTDEARDLRVGEDFTLFIVIQNPTAAPNTP